MNTPPLADLTLIALVCNNQDYARRQIAYLSSSHVTLIIADGSSSQMFASSFNQWMYGSCCVSYFHIPGAHTVVERFQRAASLVQTPYVSFIDTGDLFFITGFERALASLKADPNQSFAAGRVSGCILSADANGHSYSFANWGHWSEPFAIDQSNSGDRLVSLIANMRTANMFYGVMAITKLRKFASLVANANFTYNGASELLFAGILAANSRFAIGDYPFWVRSSVPSVDPKSYSTLDALEWHVTWPADKLYLIYCLVDELVAVGKLSALSATEAVHRYLTIHHKQSLPPPASSLDTKPTHQAVPRTYLKKIKRLARKAFSYFSRKLSLPVRVSTPATYDPPNAASTNSLLSYWQGKISKLSPSQISDISRYDKLIIKYPHGLSREQFECLFSAN